MRKIFIISLVFALGMISLVQATDDPHDSTNAIYCAQCHISHGTLGDILINAPDSLMSTLCLSCHTSGGWVNMAKEMSSAERANPGVSGTSHNWNVAADNAQYGAAAPQQQTLLDHLTADNKITCATCHNPHSNTNPPFLRLDNSADQLCLDCHRSRNMSSVHTYNDSLKSHPVGVALPSTETFHNPPLDVDGNPQPSDGNTTNDYQLGAGSTIKCTTCHGVHYTDSNSGTVDGP